MRSRAFLMPVVLGLILAACGGGATQTPGSSAASVPSAATGASAPASAAAGGGAACESASGGTATVTVSIKDFKMNPQPVNAKVGDVVAWTNNDGAPHSATMDDGSCDTDSIAAGATAMLKFTAAGTYTYHCKIHPGQMKDFTVVVQ
jgi:plastocyanin